MYEQLKNVKEFEQLLAELDAMIKADFEKFKKDLEQLAINHGVNAIFEEPNIDSLDLINENDRQLHNEQDKVSSGETNN